MAAAGNSSEILHFPDPSFLEDYLPKGDVPRSDRPHITLTYATSLDSGLSIAPGQQTALSGPESKAMTHFLRSRHDAILIGVGTAIVDDPGLNCRYRPSNSDSKEQDGGKDDEDAMVRQPRPVILDPQGRWIFTSSSKVLRLAREGKGKAPWIMLARGPVPGERLKLLEELGGDYLWHTMALEGRTKWSEIFAELGKKGVKSVMVEGGGRVVNELLGRENVGLVDSVVVTLAPTYLGKGSVAVSPENVRDGDRWVPAVGFADVRWTPLGRDVVMCGRPRAGT